MYILILINNHIYIYMYYLYKYTQNYYKKLTLNLFLSICFFIYFCLLYNCISRFQRIKGSKTAEIYFKFTSISNVANSIKHNRSNHLKPHSNLFQSRLCLFNRTERAAIKQSVVSKV